MNIVLACNNPWGRGGLGNFLARASGGLQDLGALTVLCAASSSGETGALDEPAAGFECVSIPTPAWHEQVKRIPYVRGRKDWRAWLKSRHFDRGVEAELARRPCDLFVGVAAHCPRGVRAARRRGARVWLYCLNTYLPFMKAEVDREWETLGEPGSLIHPRTVTHFLDECALADRILVNSEVAARTFVAAGIPRERLAVLTPVVDVARFRPVDKPDDTFRVLFVGTIAPRKGVHYLLDAFARAGLPGAELLLVGGAATRALRLRVEQAVAASPAVTQERWDFSRDDPTRVFGRCSVLVLPSVEDGFGVVALEGMASGLPVIVTTHCGAADVVEDGVNGFVVPPRDPTAIAEKLAVLAGDPARRARMGAEARRTAEMNHLGAFTRRMHALAEAEGVLQEGCAR